MARASARLWRLVRFAVAALPLRAARNRDHEKVGEAAELTTAGSATPPVNEATVVTRSIVPSCLMPLAHLDDAPSGPRLRFAQLEWIGHIGLRVCSLRDWGWP